MFTDFYNAYHWLEDHPIFQEKIEVPGRKFPAKGSRFQEDLYMMVVKVDPTKERIMKNQKRNTATRVWLEHGPFQVIPAEEAGGVEWRGCSHDIKLDCGGTTFEEAIIKLANLVHKHYGDYEVEEISQEELEEMANIFSSHKKQD